MKTQKSALLGIALGLAAFGAGCKDTTTLEIPPTPPPPIVVTVTPGALTLEVGQSAALAASVTGGADTDAKTVTWTTSNASVASVDGSGNVTAIAKGVAVVTATSTADANSKAAASVTVTEPVVPAPPTVSIKSITQFATNVPVALNNVAGQIDITLNLDVPAGASISALRTYIVGPTNERKVCEQTFSGGAGAGATEEINGASEIICSANTAMYDGVAGTNNEATVWYVNGPGYKIRVEIVDAQGTTTAEIQSADMIFNNPSFIVAKKTSPTNCTTGALNSGATFWCSGDISAVFMPVVYSGNANDKVNGITLTANAGPTKTVAAAPWSITLQKATSPGASSVAGVEGAVALTVFSTTAGGQTGPVCINPDPVLNPPTAAVLPAVPGCFGGNANKWVVSTGDLPATAFLVDNKGPTVPGAISLPNPSNNWIGPNVTVASLAAGLGATDAGVGSPTNLLQYRTAGTTPYTDAPNGTVDIPESTTNTAYNMRVSVCDKLANCTSSGAVTVGSDQTDPLGISYALSTPADGAIIQTNAVNPSPVVAAPTTWALSGGDALSGPFDTYGTLKRISASGTTCVFGSGTSCTPVSNDPLAVGPFTVTPTAEGFYVFEAVFRDLARNDVAPVPTSKMSVSDATLPQVQNIVLPSLLPNGGQAMFSATVTDNLDLKDWAMVTMYTGTTVELPYTGPTTIDVFGPPLVATQNVTATVDFVRSLESVTTNPGAPSGILFPAAAARFSVRDQALNESSSFNNFAAGTVTPGVSATTLGVNEFEVQFATGAPTTICDPDATGCGTTAHSTTVQAVARGMSGSFNFPFSRVMLYQIDGAGKLHFVASTTNRISTDDGSGVNPTGRVWTYGPMTVNGNGYTGLGTINLLFVGVTSVGDGLSNNVPLVVTISN